MKAFTKANILCCLFVIPIFSQAIPCQNTSVFSDAAFEKKLKDELGLIRLASMPIIDHEVHGDLLGRGRINENDFSMIIFEFYVYKSKINIFAVLVDCNNLDKYVIFPSVPGETDSYRIRNFHSDFKKFTRSGITSWSNFKGGMFLSFGENTKNDDLIFEIELSSDIKTTYISGDKSSASTALVKLLSCIQDLAHKDPVDAKIKSVQ